MTSNYRQAFTAQEEFAEAAYTTGTVEEKGCTVEACFKLANYSVATQGADINIRDVGAPKKLG